MSKTHKSPAIQQFIERLPDEDACLDHLMRMRFGERLTCTKCGNNARYYRVSSRRSYECEYCGNQVYPTAGTLFENTRTPLRDWFHVMFMFCASCNGVSAKEVQRTIGTTYKTAWRMCNLIRPHISYVDRNLLRGSPNGGIVETNEAFFGDHDKCGVETITRIILAGTAK